MGIQIAVLHNMGKLSRDHVLDEIFAELADSSDYSRRLAAVEQFNATSKTHMKGIALSPVKFGISFTHKVSESSQCHCERLHGWHGGQVSTGGTEMGQGLNTKIRQLVADEFGISPYDVRLMTTSTEKNNNTSPTAASAGTDLNGRRRARGMSSNQIGHD